MGSIHPTVSEICVPQSLDPICAKFDKFLAHGQAHMGQMGKWPWRCTTTGLDNSTELWMEKIHQVVTEIWVPQVWQTPARTVTTIPVQPGGLRGKKSVTLYNHSLKCTRETVKQIITWIYGCSWDVCEWKECMNRVLIFYKKMFIKNKHILYNNELSCKTPWAFMISLGVFSW